jgi:hypothetical protein
MLLKSLIALILLASAQQVKQGNFSVDKNTEGWTLDRGIGVRTHLVFVKFDREFAAPPEVMISLTGYEAMPDTSGMIRISSRAENISESGFVIKIWTWGSSQVNSVTGSWIAIGK